MKPFRQSDLYNALIDLLQRSGISGAPAADAAGSEESRFLAESGDQGGWHLRVLLAEDHLVNQKVASAMVRSLGHEVTVVDNGQVAVEALDRQSFDLILMDLQMTVMDGFAALAAIRARPGADAQIQSSPSLAHAMKGDRERCLAVGFDGYLSKPVTINALRDELIRLCAPPDAVPVGAASRSEAETDAAARPASAGFSFDRLLEKCAGDREFARKCSRISCGPYPRVRSLGGSGRTRRWRRGRPLCTA